MPAKKTTSTKKKTTNKPTTKVTTTEVSSKPEVMSQKFKNDNPNTFKLVIGALVVVVLAMGYMRFKYLLVPAMVNGSPVFSWQYVKMLNQTAGKQVLDQLVVEKLISDEAGKQNITLTQEEIDAELNRLDQQFESVGGLDAFLASQGLNKVDIQNQLELNLKVQKIVADKVSISDEEVDSYYAENKADYMNKPGDEANLTEEEAKTEIKQMLADQAMQQEIGTWIQDLRSKAQITINLPNMQQ